MVIAVAGALTLVLTITRLADSIAQNSQALSRERGLREASAALVAAADVPAVDEAVRAAIGQLMPPHAISRIVFATDDRQLTLAALPSARRRPAQLVVAGHRRRRRAPWSARCGWSRWRWPGRAAAPWC